MSSFNFLRRKTPKRGHTWYENPFWVTIIASLLLIIGQVLATVVPILLNPNDISDFSLSINPIYYDLKYNNKMG